jgi:hypothetical protein
MSEEGRPDEQSERSLKGLGNLVERTTPWLLGVGSWIFGGLIAFDLVVVSQLIAIGPADTAILISTTTLACALPLNVAGIFLLRLTSDLKDIGIEEVALRAFQDAGFPDIDAHFPSEQARESLQKRRATLALRYSLGIAVVSIALTVSGLAAALWHVAWWIGVVDLAMVALTTALVVVVMAHSWKEP